MLFGQNTAANYLKSLQVAQAQITQLQEQLKSKAMKSQSSQTVELENAEELKIKIKELEQQVLELRLDKIKEFGEYYEKKQELETELELNINTGIKEIQRLENKLTATNKKKLELQAQLNQSQTKNTKLELKLLNNEPSTNPNLVPAY